MGKGNIAIVLNSHSLEITNSGKNLTVEPNNLFTRFKKSNQNLSSLGLGLAIVKKPVTSIRILWNMINSMNNIESKLVLVQIKKSKFPQIRLLNLPNERKCQYSLYYFHRLFS